jgi:hypothetical protein
VASFIIEDGEATNRVLLSVFEVALSPSEALASIVGGGEGLLRLQDERRLRVSITGFILLHCSRRPRENFYPIARIFLFFFGKSIMENLIPFLI